MTDVTPEPQAQSVSVLMVLQYARDNFVLISASAIMAGIILATVFLAGYLKVFDWRLLWVVQYQDILAFALIAVALLGGIATLCAALFENVFLSGLVKGTPRWGVIGTGVVVFVLLIAFSVYGEHRSATPAYGRIMYGATAFVMGYVAVWITARLIYLRTWPNAFQFAWTTATVVGFAYMLGTWLGYSVLESPTGVQDIYLKSGTVNGAKIVMMMSHHTIFYKDDFVYVVPTDDVTRIQSARQGW